jgi:hypothetical protein
LSGRGFVLLTNLTTRQLAEIVIINIHPFLPEEGKGEVKKTTP